ncbi:MAG: HNH endonuclease [Prevotellaceae bacterium]|nr:HNH endonuclease [Prevotellaceae bacterium]
MLINGKKYQTRKVYNEALTVPDCWVVPENKLGSAHGEKKLYFGSKSKMMDIFINNKMKCVILKKDLEDYLNLVSIEYNQPKQHYHCVAKNGINAFQNLLKERKKKVSALPNNIFFTTKFQRQIQGRRGYVNSSDSIFQLIRELALPIISYISIQELVEVDNPQNVIYYWKLFVNYVQMVNPQYAKQFVNKYGKKLTSNRPGQARYRASIIKKFNGKCIVTDIDENDLLVASHIKPWALCDQKFNKEHIDPDNGLLLSTLFDRLFDQGFITFEPDGTIIYSTWLSQENRNKLLLNNYNHAKIIKNKKVEQYLKYHQTHIFRG